VVYRRVEFICLVVWVGLNAVWLISLSPDPLSSYLRSHVVVPEWLFKALVLSIPVVFIYCGARIGMLRGEGVSRYWLFLMTPFAVFLLYMVIGKTMLAWKYAGVSGAYRAFTRPVRWTDAVCVVGCFVLSLAGFFTASFLTRRRRLPQPQRPAIPLDSPPPAPPY
jgi:hypothetical protein